MKRQVKCPNCKQWVESDDSGRTKKHDCITPTQREVRYRKEMGKWLDKKTESDRRKNL
jgi:hypothetical protein